MYKPPSLRSRFLVAVGLLLSVGLAFNAQITQAKAQEVKQKLTYQKCDNPNQSPACLVALEKLKTLTNPIDNKKFFDNGLHYYNGELFLYPDLDVAMIDLDGDGLDEIIVKIPENVETIEGYFCQENFQCPHYILQDRNLHGRKIQLGNIRAMGPIYAQAIGLSTDEKINRFKSLRAYTDYPSRAFDTYQYDRRSDNYFSVNLKR